MTSLTCFTYMFLCSFLYISVTGNACPYKECYCDDTHISCPTNALTTIPELYGDKYGWQYLDVETNNITVIPAGSLPGNLTDINFSNNPITTIDVTAFDDSQDTLKSISFSGANFTRIPDAILHLRVLGSIKIYNTPIQDWNVDILKSVGLTVDTLYLVNVSLKAWPDWMQYFSHLNELSLESNFLSSLPDNALDIQSNTLGVFSLDKNNLTAVPKTISNQKALLSLSLGYNRITDLTWLPQSTQLSELSLMHNRISDAKHLSNTLRPLADILSSVELFGNQLTEIPDLSFMKLVGYLDLSQNKMSSPYSGNISSEVTTLELDYNSFLSIPHIFLYLPHIDTISLTSNALTAIHDYEIPVWIEEIDLGNNFITELTDTSFPENSKLDTLFLMFNPIVKISDKAFINLKNLKVLSLENSRLTRLPLALDSLTRLTFIELTGSTYLVCTCQEKSLRTWILSRQPSIAGNCGQASIYDFFSMLIQDCPT